MLGFSVKDGQVYRKKKGVERRSSLKEMISSILVSIGTGLLIMILLFKVSIDKLLIMILEPIENWRVKRRFLNYEGPSEPSDFTWGQSDSYLWYSILLGLFLFVGGQILMSLESKFAKVVGFLIYVWIFMGWILWDAGLVYMLFTGDASNIFP